MTRKDIDNIISALCPNDEDYDKPIISPRYLKQELEQLALEQTPCEDAISREEALKALGEAPCVWTDSEAELQAYDDWRTTRAMLEGLPSVTPTREHGRWIVTNEKDEIYAEICICDKCNFAQIGGGDFCTNCGAMMVEEE